MTDNDGNLVSDHKMIIETFQRYNGSLLNNHIVEITLIY